MYPSRTAIAFLILVVASACRSAGPSARPSAPQAPGWLDSYVGQSRIVLGLSEARGLTLARRDIGKPRPACDVAVEVRQVGFQNNLLRLRLEVLGRPRPSQPAAAHARRAKCAPLPREVELTISDWTSDEGADALDQVLQTPEAYLHGQGVSFAAQPADDLKAPLANGDSTVAPEQQALWRKLAAQPQPLLRVDAELHAANKRTRFEGEVQFRTVVGVHGRMRDVQVLTPLESEHLAHIRRVLALWRFEPARGPQGPVAAALESRLILKID